MGDSDDAAIAPSAAARAAGIAFVALLAALAVFSVRAQRHDFERVPPVDAALAANAAVIDGFAAGDAVRVLPLWWDDGRRGLDGLPILMQDPLDEWDRHRFNRLWLVYPRSWAGAAEIDRAWMSDVETIFDGSSIRVERGNVVQSRDVLWDAFTALDAAIVSQSRSGGDPRDCTNWDGRAWYCGGRDEFIFVGRVIREMDDQYRECVSANPPPDRESWQIEFDDVPAGSALEIRAGIALASARLPRGSETTLSVFVDDAPVLERAFGKEELGYPEFRVPTAEGVDTVDVRFEVRATDHLDRFFCFRAQTVR